jgi:hypothetical protein
MATLKDPTCVGDTSIYMQKHFNNLVYRGLRPGMWANYGLRVDIDRNGMLVLTGILDLPNSNRSLMVKETIEHPATASRAVYRLSRPKTEAERVAARLGVYRPKTEATSARGYSEAALHKIVQNLFEKLQEAYKNDIVQNPATLQTPVRDNRVLA